MVILIGPEDFSMSDPNIVRGSSVAHNMDLAIV